MTTFAGVERKILDSSSSSKIKTYHKPMSVAAKTREHKFFGGTRTCVSKSFNEAVCLQSEERQEWIREVRGETKRDRRGQE